jgi:hypothetical protein
MSKFIGTVGTRMNLFIKVMSKNYLPAHDSYIYNFEDRGGNCFSAFLDMKKEQEWNLERGDCIDLDAYINSHVYNEYRKVDETRLNRIKLIQVVKQDEPVSA